MSLTSQKGTSKRILVITNVDATLQSDHVVQESGNSMLDREITWTVIPLPHHLPAFLADTQRLFFWEWRLFFCIKKRYFPCLRFLPFFPLFFPPFTFLPIPPPLLCFFLCSGKGYFLNSLLLLLCFSFHNFSALTSHMLGFQMKSKTPGFCLFLFCYQATLKRSPVVYYKT